MSGLQHHVKELVREIGELAGVTVRPGVSYGDLVLLEQRLEVHLPTAYRALLLETNGLEVMHGYRRIFGHGTGAPVDLEWFNDLDTWMFAYSWLRSDLQGFIFLGIAADGAVIACKRSDLTAPDNDPPFFSVHPLSGPTLGGDRPVSHWLRRGIRFMAHNPRADIEANRYLDHFGPLPADRLILDSPPTDDDEPNLELAGLLPVADALIAQADLFRQTRHLPVGTRIVGMDTWTDERGRTRLAYRFDPERGRPA